MKNLNSNFLETNNLKFGYNDTQICSHIPKLGSMSHKQKNMHSQTQQLCVC